MRKHITKGDHMSNFDVHILNEKGIAKAKEVQAIFQDTAAKLGNVWAGDGNTVGVERLHNITMTKLEEACFFAKKKVAIQKENQK